MRHPREVLAEHFGLSLEATRAAHKRQDGHPEARRLWDGMRTWSDQQAYSQVAGRVFLEEAGLPVTKANIQAVARIWNHPERELLPNAIRVLDNLKTKYRLGIISNAMPSRRSYELPRHGLLSYFDPIVISREVGFDKPQPEIYRIALREAEVKADEAALIDDRPENLMAAERLRFAVTVLFDPNDRWPEWKGKRVGDLSELEALF